MKSPSSSPRVRRLKLVWALLLSVLLSTAVVLSPQTAQAALNVTGIVFLIYVIYDMVVRCDGRLAQANRAS